MRTISLACAVVCTWAICLGPLDPCALAQEKLLDAKVKSSSQREAVGSVLGKPVYRDEFQGDPPNYSDVANRFFSEVMDVFHAEHHDRYAMTEEEIAEGAAWMQRKMAEQGGDAKQRWEAMTSSSKDSIRETIARLESELALVAVDSKEKHSLNESLRIARIEQKIPNAMQIYQMFGKQKFERYLYKEFGGGRIIHQQLGPEALDARYQLLLSLEKQGKFTISDPKLRKLAYDYWERPNHPGGFHRDPGLLAYPWTDEYANATNR